MLLAAVVGKIKVLNIFERDKKSGKEKLNSFPNIAIIMELIGF